MSEQIIGHDCDGRPIPAGAKVKQVAGKPRFVGTCYRVVRRASAGEVEERTRLEPDWLLAEDGLFITARSVRLIRDHHTPADEDFQADLQQWLAGINSITHRINSVTCCIAGLFDVINRRGVNRIVCAVKAIADLTGEQQLLQA